MYYCYLNTPIGDLLLAGDDEALSSPNNNRLYGLLCKVRCQLKSRLAEILSCGYRGR